MKPNASTLATPAFLFIGIGVGILLDQIAAFTLIGLGVGFLFKYLTSRKN